MANAIQLTTEQIEIVWQSLETLRAKTQGNLNATERAIQLLEREAMGDILLADSLPDLYQKREELSALLVDIINTDTEVTKQAF